MLKHRLLKRGMYSCLFVFLCIVLFSSDASTKVWEYTLDNGLKILITEDHKAALATFQIWYRVGSRNEPAGKRGISHLLEHMMFKGTQKYGSKVFSRLVQKNGGMDNAFTTRDYTTYFQTLPSDRIHLSIELESDRMQNLLLLSDDVRYERSVVIEERRMRYEDDPQSSLYEEVVATAFKVHPYHNPVIGWMSDIASIDSEDLVFHYKNFYSPDNAVIVVSGDVTAEELFEKIKKMFGTISKGKQRVPVTSKEPPQRGEKRVSLKKEAKLPYILAAYHVPRFPHEDSIPLDVLSTILSGKSGRLYKALVREGKIALNVFASYDGFTIDPYLFFLGGTVVPGREIEALEEALFAVIEKIRITPPSDREVQKAKNQAEASFIMSQDSIFYQAYIIGMFEMLGDWRLKDRYLEEIKKITPEDVQRVVKKYFSKENRTVGILIPENR